MSCLGKTLGGSLRDLPIYQRIPTRICLLYCGFSWEFNIFQGTATGKSSLACLSLLLCFSHSLSLSLSWLIDLHSGLLCLFYLLFLPFCSPLFLSFIFVLPLSLSLSVSLSLSDWLSSSFTTLSLKHSPFLSPCRLLAYSLSHSPSHSFSLYHSLLYTLCMSFPFCPTLILSHFLSSFLSLSRSFSTNSLPLSFAPTFPCSFTYPVSLFIRLSCSLSHSLSLSFSRSACFLHICHKFVYFSLTLPFSFQIQHFQYNP